MRGVTVFSKVTDGEAFVSPNFRVREFACGDGTDAVFIDASLVFVLQNLRDHFGKPVYISSAYRTPEYNACIGGAVNSYHIYGMAADITVEGIDSAEVADYLDYVMPGMGGIGRATTYVHVDTRTEKHRWNY